jgi:hypothetical protein
MLSPNANLPGDLYEIAVACNALASSMAQRLPDGPELSAGLRKLIEAKDCFVAQVVWLVVGVLTCVFAVVDLVRRVYTVLALLALVAGVLLVLGAVNVWP